MLVASGCKIWMQNEQECIVYSTLVWAWPAVQPKAWRQQGAPAQRTCKTGWPGSPNSLNCLWQRTRMANQKSKSMSLPHSWPCFLCCSILLIRTLPNLNCPSGYFRVNLARAPILIGRRCKNVGGCVALPFKTLPVTQLTRSLDWLNVSWGFLGGIEQSSISASVAEVCTCSQWFAHFAICLEKSKHACTTSNARKG